MKRRLWIALLAAITAGLAGGVKPASAQAAHKCFSDGSKCKADNPSACCGGACDVAKDGDTDGFCSRPI